MTAARVHQGRPVIGLAGVESISEGEQYPGAELRIAAAEQQPLPAGRSYHHQLVGCEVVAEDGTRIGRVTAVDGEMGRAGWSWTGRVAATRFHWGPWTSARWGGPWP